MKLVGFLMLLAGWVIVVAAVALLKDLARTAFILSGTGVELLGLVVTMRSHFVLRGARE